MAYDPREQVKKEQDANGWSSRNPDGTLKKSTFEVGSEDWWRTREPFQLEMLAGGGEHGDWYAQRNPEIAERARTLMNNPNHRGWINTQSATIHERGGGSYSADPRLLAGGMHNPFGSVVAVDDATRKVLKFGDKVRGTGSPNGPVYTLTERGLQVVSQIGQQSGCGGLHERRIACASVIGRFRIRGRAVPSPWTSDARLRKAANSCVHHLSHLDSDGLPASNHPVRPLPAYRLCSPRLTGAICAAVVLSC